MKENSVRDKTQTVYQFRKQGNEKADRLAKTGSPMSQSDSSLPLRNIKRLIYRKLQINSLPRLLHRIGVKDSAGRPLCHQDEMDGDYLRHFPIVLKFFVDNL
ncbi:hypothetical protein TNCV_1323571 [Trichonephila clavipes]|nr:hypothetical protein TNCV_1323571 [Trichonephila clavipes]